MARNPGETDFGAYIFVFSTRPPPHTCPLLERVSLVGEFKKSRKSCSDPRAGSCVAEMTTARLMRDETPLSVLRAVLLGWTGALPPTGAATGVVLKSICFICFHKFRVEAAASLALLKLVCNGGGRPASILFGWKSDLKSSSSSCWGGVFDEVGP